MLADRSVDEEAERGTAEGGLSGWLTVLGAFLIQVCGFGYTTAFGVFQDYYVRELLSESSPSAISCVSDSSAAGIHLTAVTVLFHSICRSRVTPHIFSEFPTGVTAHLGGLRKLSDGLIWIFFYPCGAVYCLGGYPAMY
ncbi:MFS general substrate transporter [Mycena kentingensis (nom. inval.)]|nr:MFS general substrate transporter [Mycena kentingensis (nom. inval.)]